ncbi:MAG: hypothetical protein IK092_05830 [Muribaculaceae bacterium]|nr:hypothetical protein [Muribaculaceae bacterium]
MKYLSSIILIAFMALMPQIVAAKSSKTEKASIPFDRLAEMIATNEHWVEANLIEIGLDKLISVTEEEEFGESSLFVYGKKVKAKLGEERQVKLKSKGKHAFAIRVSLDTDNGTNLYFKSKADHDAFMNCVRESNQYVHDGDYEAIGCSYLESDEFENGWYVVSFHAG